jgi:hypothetical protein
MAQGFVYLTAVIDWFSRNVLAPELSIAIDSDFSFDWCSSFILVELAQSISNEIALLLHVYLCTYTIALQKSGFPDGFRSDD